MTKADKLDILTEAIKTITNISFQMNPNITQRDIEMWHAGLKTAIMIIETAKIFIEEEN